MKPLKKTIHKTLLEVKDKKKKTLLENKIIKNRFKIILEDKNMFKKKNKEKLFSQLTSEVVYLKTQGYDNKMINEGLSDIFKSLFGTGADSIFQTWKETGVAWLIKQLGFNPDSTVARFIEVAFANVPISEIPSLLTDCDKVTKIIAKSMYETYLKGLQQNIGMGNMVGDVMRNAVTEVIDGTEFIQKLEGGLSNIICPILGRVSSNMTKQEDGIKSKLFAPFMGA